MTKKEKKIFSLLFIIHNINQTLNDKSMVLLRFLIIRFFYQSLPFSKISKGLLNPPFFFILANYKLHLTFLKTRPESKHLSLTKLKKHSLKI